VTVVFDSPVPELSGIAGFKGFQRAFDDEARRLADLLRCTIPQGLRDRLALHLMGDLMSNYIIDEAGIAERDNRPLRSLPLKSNRVEFE
jgi:hypothetical protein